jgi:predicted unusual protein kinase regulating ubiquinone biosynthesis (AarF/ABC1/UbiB family)
VPDENSFTGRVRRYAQVGTAVGGLAARLAGERLFGIELDRAQHAVELRAALGGLKGPLMKVAQILSTIPDALPKEYVEELTQLQANAPAMGWPFVKRRMATELGADWQARFGSFEKEAARAASLGQVHRATDRQGRPLACKLQYPDMQSAVEADLGQLKLLFSLYERYDKAIETRKIHDELAARLREELDYGLEGRHMTLFNRMLAKEPGVEVPEVVPDLSTKRLLTMNWLEGEPILSYVDQHIEARNAVAYNMFRAWYVPFYEYGVIHGDPHLGNYTVRADHTVNLLDFGCVRVFTPRFVGGVIDLYRALQTDDEALAVHAYESWGFTNLQREMIDVLNIWARFLYAPLLDNRTRPIQEAPTGQYGRETVAKVHADLKRLGGVTPPREFVFMDRAAIGLGSVFMRLRAEFNWYELFHDLIEGFDVKALEKRQTKLLKGAGVPLPS